MNVSINEIIGLLLIIALVYYLFMCNNSESFFTVQFLGYENTPNFKIQSSFINFNRPDTIDWSLFMLTNRFRFQSIVPFYRFSDSPLVFPQNGLPTSPQTTPVLMVPGLGDCYMFDGKEKVWPPHNKVSFEALSENDLNLTFDSSNSNITPLIDALKALKYTNDTMSIQVYDFRTIAMKENLTELFKRIRQSIVRLYTYSNLPVVLVGQDIGCTLLSLFLSRQQESFVKEYITSVVFVGSVFGGTIQSATDYLAGVHEFGEFKYLPRQFDGLKLKLPNKLIFENETVVKYNNVEYDGKDFHQLLSDLDIGVDKEIHELQKESLSPPICETTFINNNLTNQQNKDIYDYWKPDAVHTINLESSKLFNNYDTVLTILKKLKNSA